MSRLRLVVPETVEARARPLGRAGVAFGSRFLVLAGVGLMWLVPAIFEPRFAYLAAGWDVLVVAAWLADVWRLPAPAALAIRRAWLAPSALSVKSEVRLTLTNGSTVLVRARVVDTVPHQLRVAPPTLQLNAPPNGEATATYDIVPRERGAASIGDVYIRYQSAIRIAERWAWVAVAQTIATYPNLEEAKRASLGGARSRRLDLERQRARRIRGAGRAFESLREHRDGDELHDICWTATARRAKLVTRLYESERGQPVWIVIDSGRLMRGRVADVAKMDLAVNAALTLSQVALGSGDKVGLLAYSRRIGHRLPASRGSAHLRQIMEHLAAVKADEWEADHLQAAARLLSDQKRRSLIVWMTDVADSAMTPDVVQAASQLTTRHLVVFVAIGEPDLTRAATARPDTIEQMFEAAAAQEILHRRDVLLAQLRARGAVAMEVGATLSPAIVNAYLDVKQRNRL